MSDNGIARTGMRKITDTEDGAIRDCPMTWPGVLAMLLRRIVKDQYDGKGVEGVAQWPADEDITYPQMHEIIQNTLRKYSAPGTPDRDLKMIESSLIKEFSRNGISIKYLGEFLHMLDLEWVDVTLVLGRKSGTIKSYTQHIGGISKVPYTKPTYSEQHFQQYKTHENGIALLDPSSIVNKIKRGSDDE